MIIPDTERLTFTFMTRDDAQSLYELDQDIEVMRHINGGKVTSMAEILSTSIPRLESYANRDEGWGMWKVSLNSLYSNTLTGATNSSSDINFLGWILVRPMDFFSQTPQWNNLELGWRFKQVAWGKGFATEAAKAVMDVVCRPEKINKVSALAEEANLNSIKIMQKLGMSYLKTDIHRDPLGDMELVFYQKELR